LGPCYKKLATLEEGVSKMMRMLMEEKNDMGAYIEKLDKVGWAAQDPMCFENDENADGGKKDDMGVCIEKLDKVGWAAQDPMYDTAFLLFGQSADYRKLWLHLKPESCGNWVKSVGSKFGLLDFIFRVIFFSCSCTRIFM
nr:L10-interacting MYB domain-containing protein-like [Tanacetum cinerariifolium]